ncbi:ribonuclease H-like domain-containing protein [Bacillus sp. T33-2]|uniref:ribonuclease H-like domain-containing protein n=1 Tax=Bacillus sp. T33-2 TaxID=2054168 RepID=UPI000C75942A|nr:ribonuclease H-like domain-containing protein [Bacillus sp. T33-2]PLR99701.1 hypothetical protein CVD19_01175 [Bacillus sp. T33-2]
MSLKNKLNRMKPHLSGVHKKQDTPPEIQQVLGNQEIPYMEMWKEENVSPFYFDGNYCLVREVSYPLGNRHGNYLFSDFCRAVSRWIEEPFAHPLSAAGHQPSDLVFFDTETTGLGGGAGNTIFLLGHASVSDNEVRLKQHILPYPGAEVALYQSFLSNVDYTTLVTYNGKAFDWPQVKTRHTLVRDHVPKLPSFGHFDLYHGSRRMWKHRVEKMKLSIVEKEILGFERKDDIPGFLAPMIYFDFLERKNPEGLLGVIKHNEHDILSLITLYTHLSFQLLGMDEHQTGREIFEAGRWFSHVGEMSRATETFLSISDGDTAESIAARHALAFVHKKNKQWEDAAALWMQTAESCDTSIQKEACIELAKHFEHRKKNYEAALAYCRKAKSAYLSDGQDKGQAPNIFMSELDRRIARLLKKISRNSEPS